MTSLEEMLVLLRLMRLNRSLSRGKHLLRCHNASLYPCRDKGVLPEMVANSSHCMVIVGPFNRLQGRTNSFAHRLCGPPKPRRPGGVSLSRYHTCPSFQAGGDQLLVAYLFRHRQSFFIERMRKGMVSPGCLHSP